MAISKSIDYDFLVRPPLAPPKILFPIFWTLIYILMGLAYMLFKQKNDDEKITFFHYFQLGVNAMWSIIFFIWKFRLFSIIWIIFLLILIIYLALLYSKTEKISAYLLIPYIVWVTFATYLTIGIFILNG